jgi:putative multiple sugar transport system substrate-binding protein
MINRRHFGILATATAIALTSSWAMAEDKGLIGISMPTKSSTRWISDGESMVKEFTAKGYTTGHQGCQGSHHRVHRWHNIV